MQMTGTVLSVDTRNQAETTMTDEVSGATVIELTDAGPFAAGAGLVVIEGELYPYVSVDVDADTITLAAPGMPFALPADSRVEVYPASPEKYALVDMGGDGEAVEVLVPHFLVELLPDGVREPLMQEDVTLETSGVELVLTNVRAQTPAGGLIDTYRLSDETQALLSMTFADEASRDAIIEFPQVGMVCYVVSTGLDYQYSSFGWQPVAQYVKKTANTSVTSLAVIDAINGADPDLRALLIGGTYRIEAFLHYTAGSSGGLRTAWSFSGSVVTGNKSCEGPAPGSTDPAAVSQMRMSGHNYLTAITYGGGTTATLVHEDLLMRVDGTGVLSLVWAQATSSSTATTMSSASRLYISKLADAV